MRTWRATFTSGRSSEAIIDDKNGAEHTIEGGGTIELQDVLLIETTEGKKLEYEIVAVIQDEEDKSEYAIAYCEAVDEFAVIDHLGKLLEDQELAQEILDDFLVLAQESSPGEN